MRLGMKGMRAAVMAILLAAACHASAGTVVFESTDTPPFWSPQLPHGGLGGEILGLLSQAAGVRGEIEYMPLKRFRKSQAPYMVGDPDMLLDTQGRTILPIALYRTAFFYYRPRHDTLELDDVKALHGLTLGVLRGTLENRAYFERMGIAVEESDSVESLVRKLKRGRIDFCILVAATGRHYIEQLYPLEPDNFAQTIIPGMDRPLALMISVDDQEAREVAESYRRVLWDTVHGRKYRELMERFYGRGGVPPDREAKLAAFIRHYVPELRVPAGKKGAP